MDAADAFVRVAAGDNEARDLGVYFVVECGEEVGREFCTPSVSHSLGGVHRVVSHLDAPIQPSVAAKLLPVVAFRHVLACQLPVTIAVLHEAHFERRSWTKRSRLAERRPSCAILTASTEASRSRSLCTHSIHEKDRTRVIAVCAWVELVLPKLLDARRMSRTRTSAWTSREPRELVPILTPGKRNGIQRT